MESGRYRFILSKLENYYYPYYRGLGYPEGTYDEWSPYILAHYGGLLLNTGRLDQWHAMQKEVKSISSKILIKCQIINPKYPL